MLHPFSDLSRMSIGASDGNIGHVQDAYFDDERWALRYLVVYTGNWLTGRKVLITPPSVRRERWADHVIDVNLTRDQVVHSPGIRADRPVSRQYEASSFSYYPSPSSRKVAARFSAAGAAQTRLARDSYRRARRDPHLRSAGDVCGHQIDAVDGPIGRVEDFLFDDESWALRYFVVDTRDRAPGRYVLLSTDRINDIRWPDRKVRVVLTRDEVRTSPRYR